MFKRSKPRTYNHKNIYYNPEKEAREARRRMALGDEYRDGYVPGDILRDTQYRREAHIRQRTVRQRSMLMRLIIFVALMLAVVWFLSK